MLDHKPFTQEEYEAAVGALAEENARLRAALLRIGQPGKSICYCRDGHEESVLIARAALGRGHDDAQQALVFLIEQAAEVLNIDLDVPGRAID